jgi:hypothetical protein
MSKDKERRKKLAALSFTEKIRLLEKLRARSLAFAAARKQIQSNLKDAGSTPSGQPDKE